MKIAVIGTGYVGLVHGVCLAEGGHSVVCIDRNVDRVDGLKRGVVPIHEPELASLIARNADGGRLTFSSSARAARQADIVFIAVGTPRKADGSADLGQLESAVFEIASSMASSAVLVIKSTVPVGTVSSLRDRLFQRGTPVSIAFNPEFLREGQAVRDCLFPDRVVLGVECSRAQCVLENLYRPIAGAARIQVTDFASAELAKYAANALLASRLALVNELAELAECVGADIDAVARAVGSDHRIGPRFLVAGPGFGGSCFPKDLRALAASGAEHGVAMRTVSATIDSNQRQSVRVADQIIEQHGGSLRGVQIAVWGVAFKAGTDDLRSSPALAVIERLRLAGAMVAAADPVAFENARACLPSAVRVSRCHYAASRDADLIVVMTEWPVFAATDFGRVGKLVRRRAVFDARRVLDPIACRRAGFRLTQLGVGRQLEAVLESASLAS